MNVTPLYFDTRQYPIQIHWCPHTNAHIGVVVDIPDIVAYGLTRADAAVATEKALKVWINHQKLMGNGELIPYPKRSEYADAHKRLKRA